MERLDGSVSLGPGRAVECHEGARQGQRAVEIHAALQQCREIGDAGGRVWRRHERQAAAFALRRFHQTAFDQGDGVVTTAAAVHDDLRLHVEPDPRACTGSGKTPTPFSVERKPMPPDRIDRRSSFSAKSPRLQREGEGQAEFRCAVEAGGHPFGAQARHGLSGETGTLSHSRLDIAET